MATISRLASIGCYLAVLISIFLIATHVQASEGGQSSYVPGFQDTLAGYLPPPGFYFKEAMFFGTGNASHNSNAGTMVRAGLIAVDLHASLSVQYSIFQLVSKTRLLGSYYACALVVPFAELELTGNVVAPSGNQHRSQSLSALAEMEIVPITLGWHNGRSHHKAHLVIYAPTGPFKPKSFVYTSLNRWAVEFDYGYTFLDKKTGREFDIAPGYTFNFENPTTNYLSGQEFHVDLAAIQHLSDKLGVGAVGYALIQTTPDTGSGAKLSGFEGRAYALGPIVTYNTKAGDVPISLVGKYYGEFDVSKRFEGHSYWLNISASF